MREQTIEYKLVQECYEAIKKSQGSHWDVLIQDGGAFQDLEKHSKILSNREPIPKELAYGFCCEVEYLIGLGAVLKPNPEIESALSKLQSAVDLGVGVQCIDERVTSGGTPSCGSRFFTPVKEFPKNYPKVTKAFGILGLLGVAMGVPLLGTYLYDLRHGTEASNFFFNHRIWDATSPQEKIKTIEGIYGSVGVGILGLLLLVWAIKAHLRAKNHGPDTQIGSSAMFNSLDGTRR